MKDCEVLWTTPHWNGPNDDMYSPVTAHFVHENWCLDLFCLDFKVFNGSKSRKAIYEDIQNTSSQFQDDTRIFLDTIGNTDSTGNVEKFGYSMAGKMDLGMDIILTTTFTAMSLQLLTVSIFGIG
jgi:hypothetical protein